MARVGVLALQLLLALLGRGSHGLAFQRSARTRRHPLTRSRHGAARASLRTVVHWPLAAWLLTRLELAPKFKRVALPRVQLLREAVLVLHACARRLAQPGLLEHGPQHPELWVVAVVHRIRAQLGEDLGPSRPHRTGHATRSKQRLRHDLLHGRQANRQRQQHRSNGLGLGHDPHVFLTRGDRQGLAQLQLPTGSAHSLYPIACVAKNLSTHTAATD